MKKVVFLTLLVSFWLGLSMGKTMAFAAAAYPEIRDSDLLYYGIYKDEPVAWRVLDASETNVGGEGIFLLTDGLLDVGQVPYDENSTLWEDSLAQEWCSAFLQQAFSDEELALIPATSKDEEEVYLYALSWREVSLKDEKVFFLSVIELEKYFGSYTELNKTTVEKSSLESYWWLRSPHRYHPDYHGIVLQGNMVHDYLPFAAWSARPCMNLLSQDAVMLLPAEDNGELGEVGFPAEDGRREWKLLIPEPDHPFRVTRVTAGESELAIEYSGADTGLDARLSLIVTDAQENALRYIRLERPTEASGTLTFIPEEWGITDDYRLFLVCENTSDSYITCTASQPEELIATEPPAESPEVTDVQDTVAEADHLLPAENNSVSPRQWIILIGMVIIAAAALLLLFGKRKMQRD